jgi:hypothetical protein
MPSRPALLKILLLRIYPTSCSVVTFDTETDPVNFYGTEENFSGFENDQILLSNGEKMA